MEAVGVAGQHVEQVQEPEASLGGEAPILAVSEAAEDDSDVNEY